MEAFLFSSNERFTFRGCITQITIKFCREPGIFSVLNLCSPKGDLTRQLSQYSLQLREIIICPVEVYVCSSCDLTNLSALCIQHVNVNTQILKFTVVNGGELGKKILHSVSMHQSILLIQYKVKGIFLNFTTLVYCCDGNL